MGADLERCELDERAERKANLVTGPEHPPTVVDAYDNALAESTIGLFKAEMIGPNGPWRTVSDVELAALTWVDWFNHRRLHGACGDIPPVEFEANYLAELSSQ